MGVWERGDGSIDPGWYDRPLPTRDDLKGSGTSIHASSHDCILVSISVLKWLISDELVWYLLTQHRTASQHPKHHLLCIHLPTQSMLREACQ